MPAEILYSPELTFTAVETSLTSLHLNSILSFVFTLSILFFWLAYKVAKRLMPHSNLDSGFVIATVCVPFATLLLLLFSDVPDTRTAAVITICWFSYSAIGYVAFCVLKKKAKQGKKIRHDYVVAALIGYCVLVIFYQLHN
jgi:hypothetical protein